MKNKSSMRMSKAGRYPGTPKGKPPMAKGVGQRKPTASAPMTSGGMRPPSNLKKRAATAARKGGTGARKIARRLTKRGK